MYKSYSYLYSTVPRDSISVHTRKYSIVLRSELFTLIFDCDYIKTGSYFWNAFLLYNKNSEKN